MNTWLITVWIGISPVITVWLSILWHREREYRREMRRLERWYLAQLAIIKQRGDFYEELLSRKESQ
jgi:hypothetical protein